jgi:thioredoxin reductase
MYGGAIPPAMLARPLSFGTKEDAVDQDIRDITIIGAGPVGLFASFYAGLRGAKVRVVDALPDFGGQLTALYPEKYVYDVGGFPKVLAKDLVKGLREQALRFGPDIRLAEEVTGLTREEGGDGKPVFTLRTAAGAYRSRALVIAAGIGAFSPRKLPLDDYDAWLGRGLFDKVMDPRAFAGKRVLLVGGGDTAFDWAVNLQGIASSILMIHRRDGFRAHQATIDQVQALCQAGKMELRTFWEVQAIHGTDQVESAAIVNTRTRQAERIGVDAIIPLLGFVSDLGDIANWGLQLLKDEIVVNQLMETTQPGIYAAGDIVTYPGKLKLIATGFGEACMAVNNAVHWMYPERKAFPGHSSNMEGVFGPP